MKNTAPPLSNLPIIFFAGLAALITMMIALAQISTQ